MNKMEKLKKDLTTPRKSRREKTLRPKDLLSSGSTLMDLALTNTVKGSFGKGRYYHVFGTSDSGKTFISMTAFAEACANPNFADYRLILDAPEDGVPDGIGDLWGDEVEARLEPPQGTKEEPVYSSTVEEFYYNIDDALNRGPCLYVLDSMDALDSKPDQKKFKEHKNASRRGPKPGEKEAAGSMGMAKAKLNSAGMRVVFNRLKKTKSILIIISQSMIALNGGYGEEHTFAGGGKLKFYAHAQVLTSRVKTLSKVYLEKTHDLGIVAQVKVVKNRHTGRKPRVKVPIYWATGIDDVGANIDYLVDNRHWRKGPKGIDATELGVIMKREALVEHVESNDLETELKGVVGDVWERIRQALVPNRKKRYGR